MTKKKSIPPTVERKIDILFSEYKTSHQNTTNKFLHWICIPIIVFSLVALLNSIPFPRLAFLGIYQTYINWFTVVLAIVGYYYYTLSPTLMWAMLFLFFGMQGLVILLENWQKIGGLAVWQSSLLLFIIGWLGQLVGHYIEQKKLSFLKKPEFLLIEPLWLLHFVFKKIKLPY